MAATLTPAERQHKTFHSKRVWLASALTADKLKDGEIRALCRWRSTDSIRIYGRMDMAYQARCREAACSARFSALNATSLIPVVDPIRYGTDGAPLLRRTKWSGVGDDLLAAHALAVHARGSRPAAQACTVHVPLVCTRGSHGRAAHAHAAHASTWLTRWGNHAVHASRWLTRRGRLTPTRLTHPTHAPHNAVVHAAGRFTPTRASRGRSGLHSRPVNYGASNSFRAHLRSYTSISGRPGRASTLYRTRPDSKGFWGSGLLACGMVFSLKPSIQLP